MVWSLPLPVARGAPSHIAALYRTAPAPMESSTEIAGVDAPETPKGKPTALIAVIVVGLLIGGGLGVFVTGPIIAKRLRSDPAAATTKAGPKDDKTGKDAGAMTLHVVDNLVLNPAGSGGTRFLMVNATFEMKDAAADELMKARDAEVRDVLLALIGHKTVDELTDVSKREDMKKEILASMAPLFPAGAIKRVYLPQFVIQ